MSEKFHESVFSLKTRIEVKVRFTINY